MSRIALICFALAAVVAAGVGGYWVGWRGMVQPPGLSELFGTGPSSEVAEPAPSARVIYYQDPGGRPVYSAVPRRTDDGREFRAVHASEDVTFEDRPWATAEAARPAGPRRVLYYRNPMGLPDTSPIPKKDTMGMDYIPVYEGEDDDNSVVTISPGKLQQTGVRSELVERHVVSRAIRVPGIVQLDERRVSVVTSRSEAFVVEVANVTSGERVTRGQALVRLYSPELTRAGADLLTDLRAGGRMVGGGRQRLENLGAPAEAITEMERTGNVPLSMTWRAPRAGVVLERNVIDGMKVAPGEVLFRLADISTIWVLADVPEFDLGAIRPGAPVTIRARSLPGQSFEGHVSLIYPQVDETTRATRVRIEIPNPDGILLPNMYAEVEIGTGDASPVIAVPDSAVIDTGTRQIVILDRGGGRFEPRDVKIGLRGGGFTEIREGVDEGNRVVVAANFLIDAESNLRAALRGLTPPEEQP